jgi:hypothetical protein
MEKNRRRIVILNAVKNPGLRAGSFAGAQNDGCGREGCGFAGAAVSAIALLAAT